MSRGALARMALFGPKKAKKYFSYPKGSFCVGRMVWLDSHYIPNTFGSFKFMPTSHFPHANLCSSLNAVVVFNLEVTHAALRVENYHRV